METPPSLLGRLARGLLPLLLALAAGHVLAWNAGGHRLSAWIAWQLLDAPTRAAAFELLARHPDFPHWHSPRHAEVARSLAAGDHAAVFAEAATWADHIRDAPGFHDPDEVATPRRDGFPDMLRRRDWHYVNQPLGEPPEVVLGGALHEALPALAKTLADPHSHHRAYALVWLLHLVGDLHQPLHVATRRTAAGHDHGGNATSVLPDATVVPRRQAGRALSLHRYWDDLAAPPWLAGEPLAAKGERLLRAHPVYERSVEPMRWRSEAHALAVQAYRPLAADSEAPAPIAVPLHRRQQRLAERQVARAGYRLAALLSDALKPGR